MMFHGVPVAMDDEKLDMRNLSIMDFCMPDPLGWAFRPEVERYDLAIIHVMPDTSLTPNM